VSRPALKPGGRSLAADNFDGVMGRGPNGFLGTEGGTVGRGGRLGASCICRMSPSTRGLDEFHPRPWSPAGQSLGGSASDGLALVGPAELLAGTGFLRIRFALWTLSRLDLGLSGFLGGGGESGASSIGSRRWT